jgi:hypothetical protein
MRRFPALTSDELFSAFILIIASIYMIVVFIKVAVYDNPLQAFITVSMMIYLFIRASLNGTK